jgi:hypothetical protein
LFGRTLTRTPQRSYSAVSDSAEMVLGMTDACAKRILAINAKNYPDNPHMLRVAVDSGGCSGFAYQFEMDTEVGEDDKVRVRHGMSMWRACLVPPPPSTAFMSMQCRMATSIPQYICSHLVWMFLGQIKLECSPPPRLLTPCHLLRYVPCVWTH